MSGATKFFKVLFYGHAGATAFENFFETNLIEKIDLLKGFKGAAPNLLALGLLYFTTHGMAHFKSSAWVSARQGKLLGSAYVIGVVSLVVAFNLVLFQVSETLSPGIALARFWVTLGGYLVVYICAGVIFGLK